MERLTVRVWVIVVAVTFIVAGAGGYFAGREHVKAQLRREFVKAGEKFAADMKKNSDDFAKRMAAVRTAPRPTPVAPPAPVVVTTPPPVRPSAPVTTAADVAATQRQLEANRAKRAAERRELDRQRAELNKQIEKTRKQIAAEQAR